MITFRYRSGRAAGTGRISIISSRPTIEADIEANGWTFHVIVGNHKGGQYICIPNWNIGTELAGLSDTFWNSERLSHYTGLGSVNSGIIAAALAELDRAIHAGAAARL